MSEPIPWTCRVDEIGAVGRTLTHVSDAAERQRIAAALGILSLEALTVEVAIRPAGSDGRYRMTGSLEARATQTCVVTLEPLAETIAEEIDLVLWPAEDIGPMAEGEHSLLEADVPEPIDHGHIDLGRIAYEHLAAALNPYPRRADASFEGYIQGPRGAGDKPDNPFAVLGKLKDKG